jgi:NADPH:quinone reductase-like Zn-dependent oxidoreductase
MTRSRRIVFTAFGAPQEVVRRVDQDLPPVGPRDVRVAVRASPINPADLLLITGRHAARPSLPSPVGIEGAGVVEEVGTQVEAVAPGDLVVLPPGGNWADQVVCAAEAVFRLPADLDPIQASMLSVNPMTAHGLLTTIVPLGAGDYLVQNGAASAVGRLVIRLARARGIRTVNIVRRAGQVAELEKIGAHAVLVGDEDLRKRVAEVTGGAPVALGLDAIAGAASERLSASLSDGATLVTYGLLGADVIHAPAARIVFGGLHLKGFSRLGWLRSLERSALQELYLSLAAAVHAGDCTSDVEATYPFDQVHRALAHAEAAERRGKIVLVPAGGDA